MWTIEKVLRWYKEGAFAASEAASVLTDLLDADNVGDVLPTLPRTILLELHYYAYSPPGLKWFSFQVGEVPGPEPHRLAALAAWFSQHKAACDAEGDSREKRMQRALNRYRNEGVSQPGVVALIAAVRFLDLVAPEEAPKATSELPRDVLWYVREILADGPPRIWTNHGAVVATETEGVSAVHDWIAEHGAASDAAERARDWQSLTGTWEARQDCQLHHLMPTNEETKPTDPRWRLTLMANGGGRWTTPDEKVEIAFDIDVTSKHKSISIRSTTGPRCGEPARLMYSFGRGTLHLHRIDDGEVVPLIERKEFEGIYGRAEGPPA